MLGVEPVLLLKVPPAPPSDQIAEVAPPPKEPPKATDVPPWHIAATAPPAFAVGLGFTCIVLLALAVPQGPPVVVNTSVAVPENPDGGVHVAVSVLAFGLNVPPLTVDQVPPVALPPTLPFKGAEVLPWQIAAIAAPALAVGLGFTTIVLLAVVVPQEPPAVVRVNVAVPKYPDGGDHVAFRFVALGLKVPPAELDQVPPVAPPPTEPPNAAEVAA